MKQSPGDSGSVQLSGMIRIAWFETAEQLNEAIHLVYWTIK
jgi:hypothetical protein